MPDTTACEGYCEASLDLSNQDDVGEAGAIAALDDLYANNNEGMKRLADSWKSLTLLTHTALTP